MLDAGKTAYEAAIIIFEEEYYQSSAQSPFLDKDKEMEINIFQDYRSKKWGFRIIPTKYSQAEFDEDEQLNLPSSPAKFASADEAMSAAKEALERLP